MSLQINEIEAKASNTRLILMTLCTAVFISGLDLFVVNVALNSIGHSIGSKSLSNLSWILNGYAIFYAAFLVPAGRTADWIGQKTVFVTGVLLFTAASLGAAMSAALWVLIIFRCSQAIGAAAMTPSSLSLLLTLMPPEQRRRSVRLWASSGSVSAAAGPVAGGLLIHLSWQWIFIMNLPIGILALIAAMKFIPKVQQNQSTIFPDLAGGILLTVSMGALSLMLVKGPDWGWSDILTVISLFVFIIALIAFVFRSAKHKAPIIDLSLFRNEIFTWSNISVLLLCVAFAIEMLSITWFLQEVWKWPVLQTGLAIAPGPCMVWFFAKMAQWLASKIPPGVVAAAGILLVGIGSIMFLLAIGNTHSYSEQILPGWLVVGIGYGLSLPMMIASATADLAHHQIATGSAVVNMTRQIGTVLGTSILVLVLGDHAEPKASAFVNAWWIAAAISVIGAIAALRMSAKKPFSLDGVVSSNGTDTDL